jgi:hypothetical protein
VGIGVLGSAERHIKWAWRRCYGLSEKEFGKGRGLVRAYGLPHFKAEVIPNPVDYFFDV